jgi:hypothetical protein
LDFGLTGTPNDGGVGLPLERMDTRAGALAMDVRFELEISQLERQRVAETLGCQDNEVGFEFSRHCACAAREYLDFYIKGAHPRSWNETLEYRFVLLVKDVF